MEGNRGTIELVASSFSSRWEKENTTPGVGGIE